MWTRELLGSDVYHLIGAFVIYSMLGWLLESIYMSFCNKKLTNRGFAKGPFCPIYGFGAVSCYILFSPLRGRIWLLYIVGAVSATIFEFIVGKCMIRFLGELWWDYNDKPFNYKGIICLESTLAWGFYALGIVLFLHARVNGFIDRIGMGIGTKILILILMVAFIDYVIQLCHAFHVDLQSRKEWLHDKYTSFKARWY